MALCFLFFFHKTISAFNGNKLLQGERILFSKSSHKNRFSAIFIAVALCFFVFFFTRQFLLLMEINCSKGKEYFLVRVHTQQEGKKNMVELLPLRRYAFTLSIAHYK